MHERGLDSPLTQRGGHFETDESSADDDRVASFAGGGTNRAGVITSAQGKDAGKIRAGGIEAARLGARRQEQLLVAVTPGCGAHAALARTDRGDGRPEQDL